MGVNAGHWASERVGVVSVEARGAGTVIGKIVCAGGARLLTGR
jgi:hypothetical protein